MKKLSLLAGLCLALGFASNASAAPLTLTFNELPTQPVSTPTTDLTFMGITFRFRVGGLASADARYNALGPGDFTFIQGAVLEGDANGTLTLDFSLPTTRLSFGAALTSADALTPGFTVQLFGPGLTPLGVLTENTANLAGISEGQFDFAGPLVSRAIISFNAAALGPDVQRFALDNLTIEPVPEPGTLLLFGTGTAALGVALARRRRRAGKS